MGLSGHRALITGAGQGIGRACAEVFAEQGADLVLLDRNPITLREVEDRLRKAGRKVVAVAVDLTDPADLRRGLETVRSTGVVDILVNNAGFDRPGTSDRIARTGPGGGPADPPGGAPAPDSAVSSGHALGPVGANHQRGLHLRPDRCEGRTRLLHGQGRPDRSYQGGGQGGGARRSHRECRPSRTDPNPHDRDLHGPEAQGPGSSPTRRSTAWPSRRRSPG